MKNLKTFLFFALAHLTAVSGVRGQDYHWDITYPPPDSGKYEYTFHAVDCWNDVCIAAGNKRTPSNQTYDTNVLILFRSTDGGLTWTEQDPGLPHEQTDFQAQLWEVQQIDSLNAIAAGDSGLVVKTTDGGNTWQHQYLLEKQGLHSLGHVYAVNFSDPLTGIIVKSYVQGDPNDTGNILTTSDGGNTWNPAAFCPWLFASVCHSDGGESFRAIGYGYGPIYSSEDDWQSVDSSALIVPDSEDLIYIISQYNFLGNDTLVGYGAKYRNDTIGSQVLHIIRSTDDGASWADVDAPGDSVIFGPWCMSSLDRSIVFLAGVSAEKMVVSTDHGMSWKVESFTYYDDTVPPEINGITVTQDGQGVAIFGGPFSFAASILAHGVPMNSKVEESKAIDSNMHIFPNPAGEKITISFSDDQFSILDPLGRSYDVHRNGSTLDISSLPSGVYFVSDGRSRAKFVKQ